MRDNKGRFIKGSSGFTGKHSEETKYKISLNNKSGTPEVRLRLSLVAKGKRRSPLTEFKKGLVPWNKDMKGIHLSPSSEFKKGENIGNKNNQWKGDKVGYFALHHWIRRHKGMPKFCMWCGNQKNIEWANLDHKYERNLISWSPMCRKCHINYDRQTGWGDATRRYNL